MPANPFQALRKITREDVLRILDQMEIHDLEGANMIRNYIAGLEGLAMAGEMLDEEEHNDA